MLQQKIDQVQILKLCREEQIVLLKLLNCLVFLGELYFLRVFEGHSLQLVNLGC